jgi:hypothetical protein
MEDAYYLPSIPGHGFETTIDIARKGAVQKTSVAGLKRRHDQFAADCCAPNGINFEQIATRHYYTPLLPPPRFKASVIRSVPLPDQPNVSPQPITEYTQRHALPCSPGPSQNPLLSLSHPRYGLPEQLVSNLQSLGVRSIYPWQSSCLLGKGLMSGKTNLI